MYEAAFPESWDEVAFPEDWYEICPEDGRQAVIGTSGTDGPDPYGVDILACGHRVICLWPGAPNTIYLGRLLNS